MDGCEGKPGEWRELDSGKETFLSIVQLLTEFDERSGRMERNGSFGTHYLRKAVGLSLPSQIRIFLLDLGGFVYYVVAEYRDDNGSFLTTSWIHEDGIGSEREEHSRNPDHPVHSIRSVTDLYNDGKASQAVDWETSCISDVTRETMLGHDGSRRCGGGGRSAIPNGK